MPLILAVEPDHKQAAKLTALTRSTLQAELAIVDTASHALEVLATRVPDLILTSTLLSPRDEALLTGRLRELDAAGLPVQTLVIPVLGAASRRSRRHDSSGLFSRLRRPPDSSEPANGCDPAVFAGQVEEYLHRAAVDRATVAERDEPVYPGFLPPSPPRVDPTETEWHSKQRLSLVERKLAPYETPVPDATSPPPSAGSVIEPLGAPATVEPPEAYAASNEPLLTPAEPIEQPAALPDGSESVLLTPDHTPYSSHAGVAWSEREQVESGSLRFRKRPSEEDSQGGQRQSQDDVPQSVIYAELSKELNETARAPLDDAPVSTRPESVILSAEATEYLSEPVSSRHPEAGRDACETANDQWNALEFMLENTGQPTEFAVDHVIEEYDELVGTIPLDLGAFIDDLDSTWRDEPESEAPIVDIEAQINTQLDAQIEASREDVARVNLTTDDAAEEAPRSLNTSSSEVDVLLPDRVLAVDGANDREVCDQHVADAVPSAVDPPEAVRSAYATFAEDLDVQLDATPVESIASAAVARAHLSDADLEVLGGKSLAEEPPTVPVMDRAEPEPTLGAAATAHVSAQTGDEPLALATPPPTPRGTAAPGKQTSDIGQVEVIEMLAAIRRDLQQIRRDRAVAPATAGASDDSDTDDRRKELESVSDDTSTSVPRRARARTAPSTQKPKRSSAGHQRKKKKGGQPVPIQDEWGFFDPDQCGFAALLEKLEEITEEEATSQGAD